MPADLRDATLTAGIRIDRAVRAARLPQRLLLGGRLFTAGALAALTTFAGLDPRVGLVCDPSGLLATLLRAD